MGMELAPEFGYVILTVVGAWAVNAYLSMQVVHARKKYDVKYPALYSDKHEVFNCIQRAHQNTLETLPLFLTLLVLSGIRYPTFSAACGTVYLVSRIIYAHGYYTGDPEKRSRGALGMVGALALVVSAALTGLSMLGWW